MTPIKIEDIIKTIFWPTYLKFKLVIKRKRYFTQGGLNQHPSSLLVVFFQQYFAEIYKERGENTMGTVKHRALRDVG